MFVWIESRESIQFHSAINRTLRHSDTGLKEGGSINLATKKAIACLLLSPPPLLSVMEAVRNTEEFSPCIRESWSFLPEHEEVLVVEMGNGHRYGDSERPEKPGHLSSIFNAASKLFNVYLFLRERERERERQNLKEAQSLMWDSNSQAVRSWPEPMSETLNWLSRCPSQFCF